MEKILLTLLSLFFAFWAKDYIPRFATTVNRQVFLEYQSLVKTGIDENTFQQQSSLQPKTTLWVNSFFLLFPSVIFFVDDPILAMLLILLIFLSVLDICYRLTDSKFIVLIFVLSMWQNLQGDYSSLFFTLLFFVSLDYLTQRLFKKVCLGGGDTLLFVALAPLFSLDKMLQLALIASITGISFYLLYWLVRKQCLSSLPFIPFISFSTFCLIIAKIL